MIDYIRWLLAAPEEEEDPAGTLAWQPWSRAGAAREPAAPAAAEGETPIPGRLEETGGQSREDGEERGNGGGPGRETPQWGGPAARGGGNFFPLPWYGGARHAAIETPEAHRRAEDLYWQGVRLHRAADFAGEQTLRPEIRREEPAGRPPLPDLRSLDRAFQRDARRYDGGFPLL